MTASGLYVVVAVIICVCIRHLMMRRDSLDHIPTVGPSNALLSYWTAFRWLVKANVVVKEGYEKYKGKVFKIAQLSNWVVIVTGDDLVDELRTAPESALSMEKAVGDWLQTDYTLGPSILQNTYHVGVTRVALNKNLASILPDVVDEIDASFKDVLDPKVKTGGWASLKVVDFVTRIVVRATNRAFVGVPICRVEEYLALNTNFALDVMTRSMFINLFPSLLVPYVGPLVSTVEKHQKTMMKYLGDTIRERKANREEWGKEWPNKPNDFLSWLMDASSSSGEGEKSEIASVENLALAMLTVNFVALHSTAMSFVHALYTLAAKPEYAQPMREEVERVLGTDPKKWTQDSLNECWMLDSFLKESGRVNGLGALSLPRKAIRTYTFRDGTVIPPGTLVCATQSATHYDPGYYDHPSSFDGFRFYRARTQGNEIQEAEEQVEVKREKEDDWRNRYTGTGTSFLAFGGGRHACPGRFFAALVSKSMLAHILLKYDVKMKEEGVRPTDWWFGAIASPDRGAEVLFRRRI